MGKNSELRYADGTNLIAGDWVSTSGQWIPVNNPADLADTVAAVPESTSRELDEAIAAAVRAQTHWAAVPGPVRAEALRAWSRLISEHHEVLAQTITREMGKPLRESRGEIDRVVLELDFTAGEGARIPSVGIPSRAAGTQISVRREPIGVVGAITPWNFPAVAPMRKIAPALVYGNTVVLKPALETPVTAFLLGELAKRAGIPDGVLNIVSGRGSVIGSGLASDPRVAGISFTGSTEVGRSVSTAVAERLGSTQLELGGKNAAFVHSASDIAAVAREISAAAIQASGQRCTAISRVVVMDALADDLVHALATEWDALTIGPGDDDATVVGPLINGDQVVQVAGYVTRALAAGAQRATQNRDVPVGPYFAPTVLDAVTADMEIAREEVFGPVLSVLRVPDVDAALRVVNGTRYGLASAVFTEDPAVAEQFAQESESGMVHVNHGTSSQPHVPFGGFKESGAGAYSIGDTNAEFFTRTKVLYSRPFVG